MILWFIAALLGGFACKMISKNRKAALVLAGIVLALGIAMAIPTLFQDVAAAGVHTGEISSMEAMQAAYQPPWLAFLNPILGAAFVVLGSRLKKVA